MKVHGDLVLARMLPYRRYCAVENRLFLSPSFTVSVLSSGFVLSRLLFEYGKEKEDRRMGWDGGRGEERGFSVCERKVLSEPSLSFSSFF